MLKDGSLLEKVALWGFAGCARCGRVVRVLHLGIDFTLGRHRRGRRPSCRRASVGTTGVPFERVTLRNPKVPQLIVANASEALTKITHLADETGGYIAKSELWFDGEYRHANIQIRVPVEQFQPVLAPVQSCATTSRTPAAT
jgi:hypothetical protein